MTTSLLFGLWSSWPLTPATAKYKAEYFAGSAGLEGFRASHPRMNTKSFMVGYQHKGMCPKTRQNGI